MKPNDFRILSEIVKEASDIISNLPEDYKDKFQIRHFLCDELTGSSYMLNDHADSLENGNQKS